MRLKSKFVSLSALLATALALAACSSVDSPTKADQPTITTPSAQVVPLPAPLDPKIAEGAHAEEQTSNDPNDKFAISWISLPPPSKLTDKVSAVVSGWSGEYAKMVKANRSTTDPKDNELNVTWEVASASGTILGIRLLSYLYASGDANGDSQTRTIYGSLASNASWESPDLLNPSALPIATGYLTQALSDAGLLPDDEATPPVDKAYFSDIVFDYSGDMIVSINRGELSARANGRIAVRIAAPAVSPLLSDAGTLVRDEVVAHQPFVGIPTPPEPTPTATPTPTPPPTTTPPTTPPPAPAETTTPPAPTTNPADVDCSQVSCIALTFDDGPGKYTVPLLDVLDSKGVKGTFFEVGRNVAAHPDWSQAVVSRGHELGGHSWDHRDLTKMTPAEVAQDSAQTRDAIKAATGVTPTLMRPPYGAVNPDVLANIGASAILWSVDTEDWKNRDVAITTQRAIEGAKPGAIILFHDIRESTLQAMPGIVDQLQAQGYHLVTVSTLLAGADMSPGTKHSQRK